MSKDDENRDDEDPEEQMKKAEEEIRAQEEEAKEAREIEDAALETKIDEELDFEEFDKWLHEARDSEEPSKDIDEKSEEKESVNKPETLSSLSSIVEEVNKKFRSRITKSDSEDETLEKSPKDIDDKFEAFEELSNQLADGDFSDNLEAKEDLIIKLREKYLRSIQKPEKILEEIDFDYNAYNVTRTSSAVSLEFAWAKIDSKIKLLLVDLDKINHAEKDFRALEKSIDDFRRQCINKIINFQKPANQKDSDNFEADNFYGIILATTQIYSKFFNCFLGDIDFDYNGAYWLKGDRNSEKFRYYISDLRNKKKLDDKQKKEHLPKYDYCDVRNGEEQSKSERATMFQGFWQVEDMIKELRNHAEHCMEPENKSYLKKQFGREIKDPILENESVGNFLILVSILFLMSYQFIEVMQTWIDTEKFLNKKLNK